ncbi:MAG: hypothetical protein ACO1OF_13690 [Adhaeribacter sp.]
MKTESEDLISAINSKIFFREFTFDKNDFYPKDGKKELADNVLWLDDLLILIQIKERNKHEIKTRREENNWFKNTVLKKAKNQIKDSLDFFNRYKIIPIKNRREKILDISNIDPKGAKKIIIYKPNSDLLDNNNRYLKFYNSNDVGIIHLFESEDYFWICKFLITPTELGEYLDFRERLYLKHRDIVNIYPEQYILGHFLNTSDETFINEQYIYSISNLMHDVDEYDLINIIDSFGDKIRVPEQQESTQYYMILKEIVKLKRYELKEFKTRFVQMIEDVKHDNFSLPYRFAVSRTKCGFVFIPLLKEKSEFWKNALLNSTEIFKYKHRLKRCVGVIAFKNGEYFDLNWTFFEYKWEYDKDFDDEVKRESEFYGGGELKKVERYKLK